MKAFRIVVIGHGEFAAALLATAELIVGEIPNAAALGIAPHQTPDRFADDLRTVVGRGSDRVLVLADLLGGTPYNIAAAMARRSSRIVCLAGVNLGMLVEAALSDGELDDELVDRLIEAGREGIAETSRHHARRAS